MESRIKLFTKTLSKNLPDRMNPNWYQVSPDPALFDAAVKIFCEEHDIEDNSNPDSHILERISSLIPLCEKPIDTAYVIELLKYTDQQIANEVGFDKYKKNTSMLSGYINIWNISLTNNWEEVIEKLNGLFFLSNMKNDVTSFALNFPESKALPVLLKARAFGCTSLQHILCMGMRNIKGSFDSDDSILHHLETLFDILKKIAAYDVKYILECVATKDAYKNDQDLICILEGIAEVIDAKMANYYNHSGTKIYKDKIAEIIQYAKDLLKNEANKVFFAKSREVLFHSESTFNELPKDVKGEIAGLVAKLSL